MSWWKRLFGGSDKPTGLVGAPKQTPAATPRRGLPKYIEVVRDELAVRVFVHDIPLGNEVVPCWSYVTDGLRRHRQTEMVFTLRRRPDEAETDFPQEPLKFFSTIHRLAKEGRVVEAGQYTVFNTGGTFLGQSGQVGIVYAPAETLKDVNYTDRSLAAVMLVGDEVEALQAIGGYRVLSLLGGASRYFPTPPWSDRDRPPVLTRSDLQQSLLTRTATVFLPGATVRAPAHPELGQAREAPAGKDVLTVGEFLAGSVVLRVEESSQGVLREVLEKVPPDAAVALLTTPAPEASVRLVWRPGQDGVQSIFPAGRDLSWATGGFILFLAEASLDEGARVLEDGFALQMRPDTWASLREAMRGGRRWSLPASGGLQGFTLEWNWPNRVRLDSGVLYQPENVLRQRVASQQEFVEYVGQVNAAVCGHLSDLEPDLPQALTVVMAVRPGRRARYWLVFNPGGLPPEIAAGLQRRLEQVRAPEVRGGPIAYASRFHLWSESKVGGGFAFIPPEWEQALGAGGEGVIPDAPLSVVWPD